MREFESYRRNRPKHAIKTQKKLMQELFCFIKNP